MSNTYVKGDGVEGKGLFARRTISAGTGIIIFEGEETMYWSKHLIDVGYAMITVENDAMHVNHSSNPNSVVVGNVLYASSDIYADDEITFDYGWV